MFPRSAWLHSFTSSETSSQQFRWLELEENWKRSYDEKDTRPV